MDFGNVRTYQHMHARKRDTRQHAHIRYEHMCTPPFIKSVVSDMQRPCSTRLLNNPTMPLACVLAVFVVCLTTFNVYEESQTHNKHVLFHLQDTK